MKWFKRSQKWAEFETYQFMPAALSVQSTPPNPLARWLAFTLTLLLTIAVVWACIGKINIVVSAEGKILPTLRVQNIQPYEKGTVTKVYVKNGDVVKQGQPLVELNNISVEADFNRIQKDLYAAKRSLWVKQALRNLVLSEEITNANSKNAVLPQTDWYQHPADHKQDQDLLVSTWMQYQANLQGLLAAKSRVVVEQKMNVTLIAKLNETVPLTESRFETMSTLYKYDGLSQMELFTLQQELTEAQYSLKLEQERQGQLAASLGESQQRVSSLVAQTNSQLLDEVIEFQRQIEALMEEKTKTQERLQKYTLSSPVDGVIQDMTVNTVGGVVTDAEKIMTVIPEGDAIEVEAFIANQDIGFVHEGMLAEVKIHTLPFTKYGIVEAEILSISSDAIIDEQKGLVFSMMLKLNQSSLFTQNREVRFKPGMAVTAEVQTGDRRLIEFFLSPLMRMKMESLRER